MESTSTEQLVREHNELINYLDRSGCLVQEICYIRIPYKSIEEDVFFERKDQGKRRLTNKQGHNMPVDRIKVERAMQVTSSKADGKRTIRVDTKSTYPNVVFFKDGGAQLDYEYQQLICEIAFRLWHLAQSGTVTDRDIQSVMKQLTAVVLHHCNQKHHPSMGQFVMFTDAEDNRYFAPFAFLNNKPSKQALLDMKATLDSGHLPDHIVPITQDILSAVRKQLQPYANYSLSEIKRALSQKDGVDLVASLMEQYFKTTPYQAVDLYDITMNKKEDREFVESLANSTLIHTAEREPVQMSTSDKARVLNRQFIEALINRC